MERLPLHVEACSLHIFDLEDFCNVDPDAARREHLEEWTDSLGNVCAPDRWCTATGLPRGMLSRDIWLSLAV